MVANDCWGFKLSIRSYNIPNTNRSKYPCGTISRYRRAYQRVLYCFNLYFGDFQVRVCAHIVELFFWTDGRPYIGYIMWELRISTVDDYPEVRSVEISLQYQKIRNLYWIFTFDIRTSGWILNLHFWFWNVHEDCWLWFLWQSPDSYEVWQMSQYSHYFPKLCWLLLLCFLSLWCSFYLFEILLK